MSGLWTDLPHAPDLLQDRLAGGRVNRRQAALLRLWMQEGVVTLEETIGRDRLTPAALDLERGFAGAYPDLLFECPVLGPDRTRWVPEIAPHPAGALDIHWMSRAVRDLIFAPEVTTFLGLLFDPPFLLMHSRGFLRDTMAMPATGKRRFVTVWINLEGPDNDAGILLVHPGTHRAAATGILPRPLPPGLGSVTICHPDLAYSHTPPSPPDTRLGVMAQLGPAAPDIYQYRHGRHAFTTDIYPSLEPLD